MDKDRNGHIDTAAAQVGLPPEKWSSLRYGFAPAGGRGDGKEAAHGRRDRQQAAAGRRADGPGPTGGGGGPGDRGERGQLRDELLDGEVFYSLAEAKIVIEGWRRHYNTSRPPSALGYRPPAPEVVLWPALPATRAVASKPVMR